MRCLNLSEIIMVLPQQLHAFGQPKARAFLALLFAPAICEVSLGRVDVSGIVR